MPELPEVESLRRSLLPHLIGARVTTTRLRRRDVCRPERGGAVTPAMLLQGATITDLLRHGKNLAIVADDGRALGVHLGMTGQLRVVPLNEPLPTHTHAEWTIDGPRRASARLLFRDPRRFGGLRTYSHLDRLRAEHWSALGPDALTLDGHDLYARLRSTRRAVKSALLLQTLVAGVGNIYADEALFAAGICPGTRADRLTASHVDRLALEVRRILGAAITAGGSTLRDYQDAEGRQGAATASHRIYGRGGQPCVRCGTPLHRSTVGQRTTVHCPQCQPRTPRR